MFLLQWFRPQASDIVLPEVCRVDTCLCVHLSSHSHPQPCVGFKPWTLLQVDVGPYLSGTSEAFRAYIERGLNRIKAKHNRSAGAETAPADVLVRPNSQNVDGWRRTPGGNSTHIQCCLTICRINFFSLSAFVPPAAAGSIDGAVWVQGTLEHVLTLME